MNDTLFPDESTEVRDQLSSVDASSLGNSGWIRALLAIEGIGPATALRIIERHSSIENLMANLEKGADPSLSRFASPLRAMRFRQSPLNADYEVIGYFDSKYPTLLKDLTDAPLLLWVKGNIPSGDSITIVGTRNPTRMGLEWAKNAGQFAGNKGVVSISGLALGVDSAAHQSTLDAGGTTVAILGSGIDLITPTRNKRLAERILENDGCIISEVELGTEPSAKTLVARNRIQAALGARLLMVECGVPSGTLHTVRFAYQLNKRIGVPNTPGMARSEGNFANFLLTSITDDASQILKLTRKEAVAAQNRRPFADNVIKDAQDLQNFVAGQFS